MRRRIVAVANRAHLYESPWIRRPTVALCLVAIMGLRMVVLIECIFVVIAYIPLAAIAAIIKAARDLPVLVVNQVRTDMEAVSRDWRGACRIWKSAKGDA